jgi:hypothetical protein
VQDVVVGGEHLDRGPLRASRQVGVQPVGVRLRCSVDGQRVLAARSGLLLVQFSGNASIGSDPSGRPTLEPVIDVAYMIKRQLYGVRNYFSVARMTNAAAEGVNSKIQTIKKMAYGYRNREHFSTAIFFHCGGLQIYPV